MCCAPAKIITYYHLYLCLQKINIKQRGTIAVKAVSAVISGTGQYKLNTYLVEII